MLEVEDLHAYYGKSHVLQGVSLAVGTGEIVALLGRNGVGKTTTLKAIMGIVQRRGSRVRFRGEDLTMLSTDEIARRGLGYVPEDRRVFAGLTVLENLRIGMEVMGWDERRQTAALDEVYDYFPRLGARGRQRGSTLSGGEQQMLAIARAFVKKPALLLIDEPTEGLAPALVSEIEHVMMRLARAEGIAILLVEQNFRMALRLSDRAYLMEKGSIRYHGPAAELAQNTEVLRKHLGVV